MFEDPQILPAYRIDWMELEEEGAPGGEVGCGHAGADEEDEFVVAEFAGDFGGEERGVHLGGKRLLK